VGIDLKPDVGALRNKVAKIDTFAGYAARLGTLVP